MIDLAEVENKAACEDGRDSEAHGATVRTKKVWWRGVAHGSVKSVT